MIVRRVHKLLALFFWAFSLVTVTTGLLLFIEDKLTAVESAKYNKLIWINIGAMLGLTFMFELYYQWMWRQEDQFKYP